LVIGPVGSVWDWGTAHHLVHLALRPGLTAPMLAGASYTPKNAPQKNNNAPPQSSVLSGIWFAYLII
jgi:hypothetical protein